MKTKKQILKIINNNSNVLNTAIISKNQIGNILKNVNGFAFNYILESNNKIIYIGYSSSLYYRLMQHKGTKNFDKVYLIMFNTKKTAKQIEKKLIKSFNPINNYQYK